jgi:hypothetical protein
VPAQRRPRELLGLAIEEQEAQLGRLDEPAVLELGRGRNRFGDVPMVEDAAKARVRGALARHEQMFA